MTTSETECPDLGVLYDGMANQTICTDQLTLSLPLDLTNEEIVGYTYGDNIETFAEVIESESRSL